MVFVLAQTPNQTVNFSHQIPGVPNQSSITAALSETSSNGTIWVAAGLYKENELIIPAGITIIGGFSATATSINNRIFPGNATKAQQTVLDGNYTHRVATVAGVLDGCVITKGYVYDPTGSTHINAAGGGVLINGGTVQNSIIVNNVAAEKSPSPGTIPGTFIASIGDIYCTDGTILQPTYTLNSSGQIVASLPGGIPTGKIAQGIVFYVDPYPTSGKIYIMGKCTLNFFPHWTNKSFNVLNLPDINTVEDAKADFNGRTNTDIISAYIPTWDADNYNQWWPLNYDAIKYAYEFNFPVGTQGQWYLPAAGEINKIWEVHPQMDACARDILGWINADLTLFPSGDKGFYYSSSEADEGQIWALVAYNYPWGNNWGLQKGGKTVPGHSIPVTAKNITQ